MEKKVDCHTFIILKCFFHSLYLRRGIIIRIINLAQSFIFCFGEKKVMKELSCAEFVLNMLCFLVASFKLSIILEYLSRNFNHYR